MFEVNDLVEIKTSHCSKMRGTITSINDHPKKGRRYKVSLGNLHISGCVWNVYEHEMVRVVPEIKTFSTSYIWLSMLIKSINSILKLTAPRA